MFLVLVPLFAHYSSVLQCVAVCCSVLRQLRSMFLVLMPLHTHYSGMLQCVAVCCVSLSLAFL